MKTRYLIVCLLAQGRKLNFLHAQCEAGEVYVKSQHHEGWRLVKTRPPVFGRQLGPPGTTTPAGRHPGPARFRWWRSTRSTAARLEISPSSSRSSRREVIVSSGDPAFNTTNSPAKFEREVTSERIRD